MDLAVFLSHMEHLPTRDRPAETDQRKQVPGSRRSIRRWVPLLIFLALYGLEWLIFGHRASRTQKETEQVLADLPLPPATSQVGYKSRYDPNTGYAERALASTASAQDICDFYLPILEGDDWVLEQEDCRPVPDHFLLKLRKGDTACGVYLEHEDNENRYYIRLDWAHWPPWESTSR